MYDPVKGVYNREKAGGSLLFQKNATEIIEKIKSYIKQAWKLVKESGITDRSKALYRKTVDFLKTNRVTRKIVRFCKTDERLHRILRKLGDSQAVVWAKKFCGSLREKAAEMLQYETILATAKSLKTDVVYAVSSGLIVLFVLGGIVGSNLTFAYRVVADGKVVGVTVHKAVAQQACTNATEELKLIKGTEQPVNQVKIGLSLASKGAIQDEAQMTATFVAAFDERVEGYGIYVNGVLATAVQTEEQAKEILELYKLEFVNENTDKETVGFNKNVEIKAARVKPDVLTDEAGALVALKAPQAEVIKHVIVEGDSFYSLADHYGTTAEKLMEYNPNVKPELLQLGQEVLITAQTPVLQVQTKERVTALEPFDSPVKKVDDPNSYVGVTIVTTEGVPGEKEVEYEVLKENGMEVQRVALAETVLKEPVAAVMKVGTKKRPSTASTGTFATPFYGVVTSRFGSRWGGTHTGIDLAGASGSKVVAADGGKVIFAGWSGGYGKLIKIQHDNGYITYYAHLSSINVSVGQKVAKKEFIGRVGSTGNSTGPHLHFEIRKNGKALNPANYMK